MVKIYCDRIIWSGKVWNIYNKKQNPPVDRIILVINYMTDDEVSIKY